MNILKIKAAALSVLMATGLAFSVPARANDNYGYNRSLLSRPMVKGALIGAGIGGVIGGVTGHSGDRGSHVMKGAAIGGIAGGGYGYLRQKGYLNRWFGNGNRYNSYNCGYTNC